MLPYLTDGWLTGVAFSVDKSFATVPMTSFSVAMTNNNNINGCI